MRKAVKLKFVDFWKEFKMEESIFYQILSEYYTIDLCDDADYIIYSCFGDQILYEPENKAIKIFYSGENEAPNFNVCDYGMGYEHLTLGDRYFRLPDYYVMSYYQQSVEQMEKKHLNVSNQTINAKSEFCSFVVSNARGAKEREQMFLALSQYKRVNSGGKYLNNIGSPILDKIGFESKHKFSICFENCRYRGYSTEKIVEAFAACTIPIYWGDPEISKVFNPKSFVNVQDFSTMKDAIEYIKEIDQNDDLYISMLREPALISESDTLIKTREKLSKWLCSIIDQPLEEARRTGNGFWHCEYYWRQRGYKSAMEHPLSILKKQILGKFKNK